MSVCILRAAWHGGVEHTLHFRAAWQVAVYPMVGAAGGTLAGVDQAHQGESDSRRRVIAEPSSRRPS